VRYLKSLFVFVSPLILVLSCFSFYFVVNKIVENYKKSLANEYSIILIANEPLADINALTSIQFEKISAINRDEIIGGVKEAFSKGSLDMFNQQLPYFYHLYLKNFPTHNELQNIKKTLTQLESVQGVEMFESEHTKLYSLLVLTKEIVTSLCIMVLVFSFLMILQQIRLWFFEYNEKIHILQLLGASLFYSTKSIIAIIFGSICISLVFVFLSMFMLITNLSWILQPELLSMIPKVQDFSFELIQIGILAVMIPSIAFIFFVLKHRINNDV